MRFNRVPSSYYLFDLKDPAIEEDVDSRVYGRMILLRCDSDLEFRDLVHYDKTLFIVTRSKIVHPNYCRYRLMERGRFLELCEQKYGERWERKAVSV
jgi:hypothetical protein